MKGGQVRVSNMDDPNKKPYRILVVDDDESLRGILNQVLTEDGHEVVTAGSGEEALEAFRKEFYPLVISDIMMGKMSGMELLKEIKLLHPETQVVIMTSHATIDTVVTAIRAGAYDYLIKPFEELELISNVATRALETIRLTEDNRSLLLRLKYKNQELEGANALLKEMSIRDGLTGLHNHRYFQERLAFEIYRSQRNGRIFSVIFMDVDFFKRYNDTHGHPEGDKLLIELSNFLTECLRKSDFLARYGGEEFVAFLPETSKARAFQVAELVRQKVAEHPFPGKDTQPLGKITISLGVAAFPEDGNDDSTLMKRADQALYQAKESGRNKVC
jgi:diguanylate cyclase (GGDEF)-like protein